MERIYNLNLYNTETFGKIYGNWFEHHDDDVTNRMGYFRFYIVFRL